MSNFEKYLDLSDVPFAKPAVDLFTTAYKELALPAESIKLELFPTLTKMTGGLRPNEFTILCGATGSGKTTLCANLSLDFLLQGAPHFVASVETGHTDYLKRMMSALVSADWNTGDAVQVERLKKFDAEYGDKFRSNHFWLSLYEDRFSVETLMADLAWMVKNRGIKVAIIDNLNFFMEVTSANEAVKEMDRVIHELIIFCKRIPIHLIMVMHPKKNDTGRVESEFDIKGSATAVQEAHNILLFNRPHPELIKAGNAVPGDREILIKKMRRKGKFVNRRLILNAIDGVRYKEKEVGCLI